MEKQSFLQHSVDMVISKAVGSFREKIESGETPPGSVEA